MSRDVFSPRQEEDELLQYAYLPAEVNKIYAIRYRGYVGDLPHFFRKEVSTEYRNRRDRCDEIVIYITDNSAQKCYKGDWIVGLPEGDFEVLNDDVFLQKYKSFILMMNAD